MCAPTDGLLFAEDLIVYICSKGQINWESKIKVYRFQDELQKRFFRCIGNAVGHKILKKIVFEIGTTFAELTSRGISFRSHMKSHPVNFTTRFCPLSFLIRCTWIFGLAFLSFVEDRNALEEAMFLIADDLHKISLNGTQFAEDNAWEKILDCASDLTFDENSSNSNALINLYTRRYTTIVTAPKQRTRKPQIESSVSAVRHIL